MSEMLHSITPQIWVAVAFGIFVALLGKKLWRAFTKAIDARSARIATELEEAEALRKEAEATLTAYQKRQREAMQEIDDLLAQARKDADALRAHAQTELKQLIEQRTKQTLELITQEERQTLQEVREHVVALCLAAAKLILTEQLEKEKDDPWISGAIDDIPQTIH